MVSPRARTLLTVLGAAALAASLAKNVDLHHELAHELRNANTYASKLATTQDNESKLADAQSEIEVLKAKLDAHNQAQKETADLVEEMVEHLESRAGPDQRTNPDYVKMTRLARKHVEARKRLSDGLREAEQSRRPR